MDYDKSEIATIYDEARALTPDRSRQWRDVLSTHIDQGTISLVVDLGCGTGRFAELLATHFRARLQKHPEGEGEHRPIADEDPRNRTGHYPPRILKANTNGCFSLILPAYPSAFPTSAASIEQLGP